MYQKPVKQQRFSEEKTCSITFSKAGLKDDINFENQRVNVDSAKKIAVMQHMDYDNFHQMVLGANIKPMKAGQLESMAKKQTDWDQDYFAGKPKGSKDVIDSLIQGSQTKEDQKLAEVVTKVKQDLEEIITPVKQPQTQLEFQKIFKYELQSNEQRFKLLTSLKPKIIKKIFKSEINSELLTQMIKVMLENVNKNEAQIASFLKVIAKLQSFEDSLMFFVSEDKANLINLVDAIGSKVENAEKISKIKELL